MTWWSLFWYVIRHPRVAVSTYASLMRVKDLLTSEVAGAVRRAVEKTAADPSFHPTKDHTLKRKEVVEWTAHYLRDAGKLDPTIPWPTWEVGFLLEWMIGERKGRL